MNILTVLISHNRDKLTKQTLESYLDTTPNEVRKIIAVDNASTDGNVAYLSQMYEDGHLDGLVLSTENKFPGWAANTGWQQGIEKYDTEMNFELLHRSDNDLEYRDGWYEETVKCFQYHDKLGQLGIMNQEQEFYPGPNQIVNKYGKSGHAVNIHWSNIGGPCVLLRDIWNLGVRFDEKPWYSSGQPTPQEDVFMSMDVRNQGYWFANMIPMLVWHLGDREFMKGEYEDYYRETFSRRGYNFDDWMAAHG